MTTQRQVAANPFLAGWRLLLLIIHTTFCALRFLATALFAPKARFPAHAPAHTHRWTAGMLRIFGIDLKVRGPLPPPGSLLAPNHMGYADILTISASVPTFIMTRTEYAAWPVVGHIIRMSGQPAVARQTTKDIKAASDDLAARFRAGHRVCVFLEGTSTAGDRVLAFRTPLLQGVIDASAPIVPVAIHWTAANPAIRIDDDVAYWKHEHHFGPHVWRLLGLQGLACEVTFGEPISGTDRKQLGEAAHEAVRRMTGLPTADKVSSPTREN